MDPSHSLSRSALLLNLKMLADKHSLSEVRTVMGAHKCSNINSGSASDGFCLFFELNGGRHLKSFASAKQQV